MGNVEMMPTTTMSRTGEGQNVLWPKLLPTRTDASGYGRSLRFFDDKSHEQFVLNNVSVIGNIIKPSLHSLGDYARACFFARILRQGPKPMPEPAVTLGGGCGPVKGVSRRCQVRESTDWYFPPIRRCGGAARAGRGRRCGRGSGKGGGGAPVPDSGKMGGSGQGGRTGNPVYPTGNKGNG